MECTQYLIIISYNGIEHKIHTHAHTHTHTHTHIYICKKLYVVCYIQLFATPWNVACRTSLSMIFFREEYWNGVPFSPPEDLPDPGIKSASPVSPAMQVDSIPISHQRHCIKLSVWVCVCV